MPETQNVYTQTRLPAWIQPYYEHLAARAQGVADTPYEAYGDPRMAGFTGAEQAAQQGITQFAQSGGPRQFTDASNYLTGGIGQMNSLIPQSGQIGGDYASRFQSLGGIGTGAGQDAASRMRGIGGLFQDMYGQAGNPELIRDANLDPYMNQYSDRVTDIAQREAMKMANAQRSELGSRAAAAGGFGGYRHGLQESAIDQNTAQLVNDIRTRGLESGYNRALQSFEADRAAQAQGMGMQQNALYGGLGAEQGAFGAQMGGLDFGAGTLGSALGSSQWGQESQMGGLGQLAGMSGQLAGMGAQSQNMFMDRMSALEGVGNRQRSLQQAGLDMGYQDFLNQRDYPMNQLSWFSSILEGTPSPISSNQSYSAAQPSFWNSMLGTGIGGLGMWQAMQGNSSYGGGVG